METIPSSPGTVLFGFGYPVSRDAYFSMFKKEKFHFLTASTGDEVLRLFHDHAEVSLVILTAEMGGLNGFEILQQMKIARSGIPVFLLSASISFESLKLASLYGCNEFLQLPLQKDELMMLINKYLYQL
jgi:DNA-binding NtrC family response regulator